MILLIDTCNNPIKLKLLDRDLDEELSWEKNKNESELLMKNIKSIVGDKKNNIEQIIVVRGYGSYTGSRIGVSTANALAYSLNIPIYSCLDSEIDVFISEFKNNNDDKFKLDKLVVPEYKFAPKITIKK